MAWKYGPFIHTQVLMLELNLQAWKRLDMEGTKFAIPDSYKTKKIIEPDEPLSLFLPEPVAREGICCLHLMDVSSNCS